MNAISETVLPLAGFSQPVDEAQAVFRQTLDALSQPGRVHQLAGTQQLPVGLSHAMTALLLTLTDADTPVWLPDGVDPSVRAYLRFHCGCPLLHAPDALARASFVAIPAGFTMPALSQLAQGQPAYPDRSATLLIEVSALREGQGVCLKGPGIPGQRRLIVAGLPGDFWDQWRDNQQVFPLGVDVFFTQAERVCGLPRTTITEF